MPDAAERASEFMAERDALAAWLVKHAGAKRVTVDCDSGGNLVTLEVVVRPKSPLAKLPGVIVEP